MRWLMVFALAACSRKQVTAAADSVDAAKPPAAPASSSVVAPVVEAPTAAESKTTPEPSTEAPKPKLVPFLSIAPTTVPPGAYALKPVTYGNTYAPKGFDPLKAPGGSTHHLPGGVDVITFSLSDGASDSKGYVAIVRGGKVEKTFGYVYDYAIDATGGRVALNHVRADASGKRVHAREILDVASGALSPLPSLPCVSRVSLLDSARWMAIGYEFDEPGVPHAWICMFDAAGKLSLKIDAGLHNHHAASIDFINWNVGVLAKEPSVVWAIREYESYGNYDITFIDSNPPHARKYARLATPGQLGSPNNLELDLAETTMASDEIKFRGKSSEGWWWKWQTAKLKSE